MYNSVPVSSTHYRHLNITSYDSHTASIILLKPQYATMIEPCDIIEKRFTKISIRQGVNLSDIQYLIDIGLPNPAANGITCMGSCPNGLRCKSRIVEDRLRVAIQELYSMADSLRVGSQEVEALLIEWTAYLLCSTHEHGPGSSSGTSRTPCHS